MTFALPFRLPLLPAIMLLLALLGGGAFMVHAQLEGSDRGIPPIDSASSYEVGGIAVDVFGKDAEQARQAGWRIAQRKGWQALWSRMNGGTKRFGSPVPGSSHLTDSAPRSDRIMPHTGPEA